MKMQRKKLYNKQQHTYNTRLRLCTMIITMVIALGACTRMPQPRHPNNDNAHPEYKLSQHIPNLYLASTPRNTPAQIIEHTGFTLSYNETWKIANWVGYELTAQETKGEVKRTDYFNEDPQVKGYQVRHADYTHSGFDRGHLAPAADMKWSKQAMVESFYMSNICPQVHAFNAGRWNDLEEKVRKWAQKDSAIIVVCGPIVPQDYSSISKHHIAVPRHFFKIIASPYSTPPRGIAFIMPNEDIDDPLYTYAVTIDSVEKTTDIDFLYTLPDSIENYIEQQLDLESWHL